MVLRDVIYVDSLDGVTPGMLDGFFDGWPAPPSPETHLRILRGSAHVVLAVDRSAGRVVGFVNALSDGVISAYLPLLEVLPAYRRLGIGRELVTRMLHKLEDHYMIDIVCDPDIVPFYERLGFARGTAMMQRNYNRQSGQPKSTGGAEAS
ncbi:MAG: GNAT family N-acetyltransferase [Phycisphaerales bacterium]|nr:MAG: GNAT family N-acetyltransferase [Phycisphaerales bacterium]